MTATDTAARPTPDQVKDPSGDVTPDVNDDVKLTSKDIGRTIWKISNLPSEELTQPSKTHILSY